MTENKNRTKTIRRVTLYSRAGCHLCDEVKEVISRARKKLEFELEEVDIESDLVLLDELRYEIPVVAIDGRRRFRYRLQLKEFLKALKERGPDD
jgi:glutaredoxin